MNRIVPKLLLMGLMLGWLSSGTGLAAPDAVTPVGDIIRLESKPAPKIDLSKPANDLPPTESVHEQLNGPTALNPEDSRNLDTLWKTVLTRNPVIQYSLKELATPPALRYAHSSVMARTIGGLLSGMAMLPYAMGADQITSGATTIGANLVDHAMAESKKIDPAKLPSDTELVELSGLIQDLQKTLVANYFEYKGRLTAISQLEQSLGQYQHQLSAAEQTPDPLDDLWARQLYNGAHYQLLKARQAAQRNYLTMERLVGIQGMQTLRFGDLTQTVWQEAPQVRITAKPIDSSIPNKVR